METTPFAEYRCACNRLLFRGVVLTSRIQIKCKRCNAIVPFGPEDREDAAHHYGLIVDKNGIITEVSDTASDILGYAREELVGMEIGTLSPYRSVREQSEKKYCTPFSFNQVHRTKSGSTVTVRTRIECLNLRSTPTEVHLCEALSPLQENLVHDIERREGLVVQGMIAEIDRLGFCTYVSDSFAQTIDQDSMAMLGASIFDIFDVHHQASYRQWFNELSAARSAYSIKGARIPKNAAEAVSMNVYFTPTYRDDGCLRGYTLLFESYPHQGASAE